MFLEGSWGRVRAARGPPGEPGMAPTPQVLNLHLPPLHPPDTRRLGSLGLRKEVRLAGGQRHPLGPCTWGRVTGRD